MVAPALIHGALCHDGDPPGVVGGPPPRGGESQSRDKTLLGGNDSVKIRENSDPLREEKQHLNRHQSIDHNRRCSGEKIKLEKKTLSF